MPMMGQPGMVDPVEMFRRRKMMAPPPMQPQAPPPPNPAIPPPFEAPRPALEGFRAHLGAIPGPESAPRIQDRIIGALVGAFSNAQQGASVTGARRANAMADWGTKAGALKTAADMENAEADDKLRATIASIKADQDERNLQSNDAYRQGRVANDTTRTANDAAYKEGQLDLGGQRVAVDRDRQKSTERYQQGQLGIGARNAASNEKRTGAYSDYLGFKKTEGSKRSQRPPSPASQDKAQQLATEDVITSNPEWEKYIDPNTGAIKPPSGGFFGGQPSESDQVDFQAFLTERAKRAQARLKGSRYGDIPLGDDEDEEE